MAREFAGREGGKRTNIGGDAGQDHLAFARGSYRGSEVRIVPRVDFAVTLDVGRIGRQLEDFLGKGTVRACLGTRGQDNWQVEQFGNRGVGDDVVSELGWVIVPSLDD